MNPAVSQSFRKGALALGVCASLALGSLGFAGGAEARVAEGDRMSASARVCGALQDQWDAAKAKKAAAHTNAPYEAAEREMSEIEKAWVTAGCGEWYGSISALQLGEKANGIAQATGVGLDAGAGDEQPRPPRTIVKKFGAGSTKNVVAIAH